MRESTIWMNVTTSLNWHRPVVGIVRVEKLLAVELRKVYGYRFKECHWDVDRFIERQAEGAGARGPIQTASLAEDGQEKRVSTLNHGRFKRFVSLLGDANACAMADDDPEVVASVSSASTNSTPVSPFASGDVLISVGLDWDYPYYKSFHSLRAEQGVRVITCCHDLIPILYPQYCVGHVARYFKDYLRDVAMGSDAILCVSRQSDADLRRVLSEIGTRVPLTCVITHGDNVPTGMGEISQQVADTAKQSFLLYVSTIERRKNHEVLYQAYHLLCDAGERQRLPKLVFVGMPGWGTGDFLKDVELDPLTKGLIIQFNNVNDAELRLLYEAALFCVYPSLYEGWGLPVGEALALGKAVLSSDRGSLPEVGGDLVRYVDPWNPVAWAREILSLSSNREEVEAMEARVRATYRIRTWAQTAATVKDLISRMLTEPTTRGNP